MLPENCRSEHSAHQQNSINHSKQIIQSVSIDESCLFELLEFQKLLNIQLLINRDYIDFFLRYKFVNASGKNGHCFTSSTSDGVDFQRKTHLGYQTIINIKCKAVENHSLGHHSKKSKHKAIKKPIKKASKQRKQQSGSEYDPEQEQQQGCNSYQTSQSKNVPKNISKAILLFIKKKQFAIKQMLRQMDINNQEFMGLVMELKGKINAISELRSLWLDNENKYAKIFRILSNYYLRKHSLQHIFNSRIFQHEKHLKYRQRMIQALRQPQNFTYMKNY